MPRETDKNSALRATDPEIHELIRLETKRQDEFIRLIPSENYASGAVIEATGSVLNEQVLRGLSGQALLRGSEVHRSESRQLAIERAKAAVRRRARERAAVLGLAGEPRRLLRVPQARRHRHGLGLPAGGHLTHGWNVSITGSTSSAVQYGVARRRIASTSTRCASSRERASRSSCSAAARRIRARSSSPRSRAIAKEVGAIARRRHRAHRGPHRRRRASVAGRASPTSSRRRRTRRCAARAAACSCARRRTRRRSIARCSPASKAARTTTRRPASRSR